MADALLINCAANAWTKVATSLTTCKVNRISGGVDFVHTYRTTGSAAPTAGDASEGVRAFIGADSEYYSATEAVDIYFMPLGNAGVLRLDDVLKF